MKKSLKFCKKKNGFTLIELVITIAIVIILSVVSVPIYRSYIDKAEKSEAYALLGILISAQKAYYSEYGNFLAWQNTSTHGINGTTCNETVLGIDARGNKYFTWFQPGPGISAAKTMLWAGVVKPEDLKKDGESGWLSLSYKIGEEVNFY